MGLAIDHDATGAADALTAVVVEGDRLFPLGDETFVQNIEHLEKGHLLGDPGHFVGLERTGHVGAFLPPDLERHVHL